eukprot:TRINITY_DN4371_c0_g1_i1.p1 TRINITY_DN4371_c0_g1~~TRINITY_DN4371_c0_g1_i1.p1  ORF type:complete len:1226 (+),score=393.31 TRINITY_DN4371_c0_g1_i1:80-3757(+)
MGCGGSTEQPKSNKTETAEATPKDKKPEKHPGGGKQTVNVKDGGLEGGTHSPAVSGGNGSGVSSVNQCAEEYTVLPGRERVWPGMKMCTASDKLFIAYSHITSKNGLTFACYNIKSRQTYSQQLTDEQITTLKETLGEVDWPAFWKMLNNAFTKGYLALNESVIEVKMRQGKEPKDLLCKIPVEKASNEHEAVYLHFLKPFPRLKGLRLESKDSKGQKENEFIRKEAEMAIVESILEAGDDAEKKYKDVIPELKEKATKAKRAVGKQEGKVAKMKQVLNHLNGVIPSHPLDKMYDTSAPCKREFTEINCDEITWDYDVIEKGLTSGDVAISLLKHYDLINYFNMDEDVIVNYWSCIEDASRNPDFHSSAQSAQTLCCIHHLIKHMREPMNMTNEDVLALILAAGIYNVGHEGVDDAFVKKAQSMLSMLYSDLYANCQNQCTVAFELMNNPHCALLEPLNPDAQREVIETVREVIVIRANVQMATREARLLEFKNLISSNPDWAPKDNQRLVLTHMLQLAKWSAWSQAPHIMNKWVKLLAEEFYKQGEKEIALGITSTSFSGTKWSTDSSKHEYDFASGQVAMINNVTLPLAIALTHFCKDLQHIVDSTNANKKTWEEHGRDTAKAGHALASLGRTYKELDDCVVCARPGPDDGTIWITVASQKKGGYSQRFGDAALGKREAKIEDVIKRFDIGDVKVSWGDGECTLSLGGSLDLSLPLESVTDVQGFMLREIISGTELRQLEKPKIDKKIADLRTKVEAKGNRCTLLENEKKTLEGCIEACNAKVKAGEGSLEKLEEEVRSKGGDPNQKLEIEDALAIKVRNPLKSPLPPGDTKPPSCKDVDNELLKLLKSRYMSDAGGVTEDPLPTEKYNNVILPYFSSDFYTVTQAIDNPKRQLIYDLVNKLDEWDFNVFELQTAMSGGISGEYLREQPHGGSLFISMYALCFKWGVMQKFNINEQTLINWLSIVEAGYHPNPYHNSMHAADVLHVTHYILGKGGCKALVRATDQEVFAALFAAAIHDYNHPGINNAFHVRSQNYLAQLFNDRSVNENIHASSVFELMRMDEFNILKAFEGEDYSQMRDDIVEFVLGTDMGLHSMFVTRFKKRIDETETKMYKLKSDRNLALTMAIKMADISNCGRPKKLYHGWCNVIVDEFFQQGDRERLHGMPVSPFMDRYTTVMSKGQIGFMNYIVMPLFECMGEFLEHMQMATSIVDENKGFWQENEDW